MTAAEEREVKCPGCSLVFPVKVVTPDGQDDQAEECGAVFPDDNGTRCTVTDHGDEEDPEHRGENAHGSVVTWRASEFVK